MEYYSSWKPYFLDLIFIPLALLAPVLYHLWLWGRLRSSPHRTTIAISAAGHRLWVLTILKDNDKKAVLGVQTVRNMIMWVTLMATTSVLLCTGLAAVLSSTYSVKNPVGDAVVGAHGERVLAAKYAVLLTFFLFAFVCYSLALRFLVHLGFLINSAAAAGEGDGLAAEVAASPEYACGLMERGMELNTAGNRIFYAAIPLLLWIFGPVLAFMCSAAMLPVLYSLDIVAGDGAAAAGKKGDTNFAAV